MWEISLAGSVDWDRKFWILGDFWTFLWFKTPTASASSPGDRHIWNVETRRHRVGNSQSTFFTALHLYRAVLSIVEMSVCPSSIYPSVGLSLNLVIYDKTKEISDKILYSLYNRSIHSFLRERLVGGGRPILPEILGQSWPRRFRHADFHPLV